MCSHLSQIDKNKEQVGSRQVSSDRAKLLLELSRDANHSAVSLFPFFAFFLFLLFLFFLSLFYFYFFFLPFDDNIYPIVLKVGHAHAG